MARRSKKSWLKAISSGAAMADMALLLMIFFMTTTVVEPPRKLELEPPTGEVSPSEQQNIRISVDRQGVYYLNSAPTNLNDIYNYLVSRKSDQDSPVAIIADKHLKYSIISELTETLQKANFLNITFIVEEKKASK